MKKLVDNKILIISVLFFVLLSVPSLAVVSNNNYFNTKGYNVYTITGLTGTFNNSQLYYSNGTPANSSKPTVSLFNGGAVLQYETFISNSTPIILTLNVSTNTANASFKILYQEPINIQLELLHDNVSKNYSQVQSYLSTLDGYNMSGCGTNQYCTYTNSLKNNVNYLINHWDNMTVSARDSRIIPFLQPKYYFISPPENLTDGQQVLISVTTPYNGSLTIMRNDSTLNGSFINDTYYNVYEDRDYIITNTNTYGLSVSKTLYIYSDTNNSIFAIVIFFGFLSIIFTYFSFYSSDVFIRLGLLAGSSLMAITSFIIANYKFSQVYSFSSIINIIPALMLLMYGLSAIMFIYASFTAIPALLFYNRFIKKKKGMKGHNKRR